MKKITGLVMACAGAFALNALMFGTGKTEPPPESGQVASLPPSVTATAVAGTTSVPPPTWAVPVRSLNLEEISAVVGDVFPATTRTVVIAAGTTATSIATVGQDFKVLGKEVAQMGATLAAGMA